MTKSGDDQGLSITAMTIGCAVLVTWLLWGVSCAMYEAAYPPIAGDGDLELRPHIGRRTSGLIFAVMGVVTFVVKSCTMLPQVPTVMAFLFRERFWFVIVAAGVLAGVGLFGVFLKRMELALAGPQRKKRRRRR